MSDLSDSVIIQRRSAYAGCGLDAANASIQACKFGDTKCADEKWRWAVYYKWAQSVASRVNTSTETCGCVTQDFAKLVFAQADPACVHCACAMVPVNPVVPVYPCNIVQDYMVPQALDAGQYDPSITGFVYVTGNVAGATNPWSDKVGYVMDDAIVVFPVPTGWTIYAQSQGLYWVQTPTGPGAYFPLPILTSLNLITVEVSSQWPNANAFQGFQAKIELYIEDAPPPDVCALNNLNTQIIADGSILSDLFYDQFYPRSISGSKSMGILYIATDTGNFIAGDFLSVYGYPPDFTVGDLVSVNWNGTRWDVFKIVSVNLGRYLLNQDRRYIAGTQAGWDGTTAFALTEGMYITIAAGDVREFFLTYDVTMTGVGTSEIVADDTAAAALSANYVIVEYLDGGVWTLLGEYDDTALVTPQALAYPSTATEIRTTIMYRGSCPPPVFACEDAGTGNLTIEGGTGATLDFDTTTGYIAVRDAATGIVTPYVSGSYTAVLPPGSYCFWSSDSSGAMSGTITGGGAGFQLLGNGDDTSTTLDVTRMDMSPINQVAIYNLTGMLTMDMSVFTGLASGGAFSCPSLTTIVPPPSMSPAFGLDFSANALSQATIGALVDSVYANGDVVTGTVDLSGGTNATPDAAALVKISAMAAWTHPVTVYYNP